jgi:CubicO group peptidase (beta-lactamase class C family)
MVSLFYVSSAVLLASTHNAKSSDDDQWPTKGWVTSTPASVGLDEHVFDTLDKDFADGKFLLMDGFVIFRCGKKVYERTYVHDYAKIYGKEASKKGALNQRQTAPFNYFDPHWHPYYHGTDMHSMQSVTKTITSVIIGVAKTRGDFKAALDTPVLKYFDASKVKNVDGRKRRMTLHDLLTMTAGLEWNEDLPNNDPRNDMTRMEGTDDWVQYAIDKPMAEEPGKLGNYNSGATELLAHIFQKETGQDIDDYGEKYLFAPLGMKHYWKRTYLGVVDAEGGLFLSASDLAKIGYLYLQDGVWEGKQIVTKDWVKESVTRSLDVDGNVDYGYLWWLQKQADSSEYVWMARGFGQQHLMVFPKEKLIAVFTGWRILGKEAEEYEADEQEFTRRILSSIHSKSCGGTTRSASR